MKLEFKVIGLTLQRPTEVRLAFVELYDTHIRYRCDFTADEFVDDQDQNLGYESHITNLDSYIKKEFIVAIEKNYVELSNRWLIYIGSASCELKIFFKTEEQASDFQQKLIHWWLGV